ncbi:MAG TPA: hypothetical protein PL009_00805 [Flavipsychrobacter sp.]|nr:hypothetical protein [Flavipsychrobacter sp.]
MKKLCAMFVVLVILSSCENTWDSDARDLFHSGCMESAKESNMEEVAAKSMCDCRLERVMKKYPNFADAMRNVDKLMDDPELKACR